MLSCTKYYKKLVINGLSFCAEPDRILEGGTLLKNLPYKGGLFERGSYSIGEGVLLIELLQYNVQINEIFSPIILTLQVLYQRFSKTGLTLLDPGGGGGRFRHLSVSLLIMVVPRISRLSNFQPIIFISYIFYPDFGPIACYKVKVSRFFETHSQFLISQEHNIFNSNLLKQLTLPTAS